MTLRVEIDRIPMRFSSGARDWTEIAITRLLAEPLFVETPRRGIRPLMARDCERLDRNLWRMRLRSHIRGQRKATVSAHDVARQIAGNRRAQAGGMLPSLMISEMTIEKTDTLLLRTRFPIAHLDRVLASPTLAPMKSEDNQPTGRYRIGDISESCLRLKSNEGRGDLIMTSYDPDASKDAFEEGLVDVSGPMSIPVHNWKELSTAPHSQVVELDFRYVLIAACSKGRDLIQHLNLTALCEATNGLAVPSDFFTTGWLTDKPVQSDTPQCKPLEPSPTEHAAIAYARFVGNAELAVGISNQLSRLAGYKIGLEVQEYDAFLVSNVPKSGLRLTVLTPPWPHPTAFLVPYLLTNKYGDVFSEMVLSALAEPDLARAEHLSTEAEKTLKTGSLPMKVLGRVSGCMRSRIGPLQCPPSGWLDYDCPRDL